MTLTIVFWIIAIGLGLTLFIYGCLLLAMFFCKEEPHYEQGVNEILQECDPDLGDNKNIGI